jgi:hypothetical protein
MIRIKLELKTLTDQEVIDLLNLVSTKMQGNASFPTPDVPPQTLTADADGLQGLIAQRDAILQEAQQMTLQIRAQRDKGENDLTNEGAYVEKVINTLVPPATTIDPTVAKEKARSAGMSTADDPTPVGDMPKITGLTATQGDSAGEVDLAWNPIKRGLKSYIGEQTEDPAGQTGWTHAFVVTKSSATVPGLVSGKRYWFRVAALGAAGQGPWSDPATKVAP